MLRCSNAEHIYAVFQFTCLNEDIPKMPPGEPITLCPACQSNGRGPVLAGVEKDEVPCDQCSPTFKDSAALADRTKEAHSQSAPDAPSNPAIAHILRALQESQQKLLGDESALQQGQIKLQQVVSTMQQGQQELRQGQPELQQGLQRLLENAPAMQQGQYDLRHMASAMQQGQHELQQHVSEMQEGQQRLYISIL